MQQCTIIYCSLTALHVLSDIFAHHQEHLNCFYSFWYYTRESLQAGNNSRIRGGPKSNRNLNVARELEVVAPWAARCRESTQYSSSLPCGVNLGWMLLLLWLFS